MSIFLFQALQFIQTVLIQFSISTVCTVSKSKTIPFQKIQFRISTQLKCKYSLIVKNISISSDSVIQTVLIKTIQFSRSMQLGLFNQ